jgi:ElaB/YqjD/DUF883 family membrane-anchored ribosome-binding protein
MTETENMDESAQDTAADLASMRADIVKLTDSVTTLVKAQVADKTDMFYGAVDSARQKLSDGAADAKDRLSGASSTLEASIERNPLPAVLIAMGAGLVIGLLSRGGK